MTVSNSSCTHTYRDAHNTYICTLMHSTLGVTDAPILRWCKGGVCMGVRGTEQLM